MEATRAEQNEAEPNSRTQDKAGGVYLWRAVQQEPPPRPEASYASHAWRALTYTKNLHLPFEKAPGHVEEVTLVEGQTLTLVNGRRLAFPSLPEGWAGLGDKFTTCRNFQFAVHNFGFSEQTVRAANNGA